MADKRSGRDEAEKATQYYAALSVGLICLLVGVPVWWKTTEIYRVQLPFTDIAALSQLQVTYLVNFDVVIFNSVVNSPAVDRFVVFAASTLNMSSRLQASYKYQTLKSSQEEDDLLSTATSVEQLEKHLSEIRGLDTQYGNYTIYVLPKDCQLMQKTSAVVGKTRIAFVSYTAEIGELSSDVEHIVRNIFINQDVLYKVYQSAEGRLDLKADKDSMRALRSTPGYDVTFTLLNPQPEILKATWDVADAVHKYMSSLLETLKEFADITVKSQYLFSTGLGVQVERLTVGSRLTAEQLPHIINPVEAYLGSHVSTNPNMNFLVYLPTREQSPLDIYDANGVKSLTNAFLSPRWGGLLIYNVDTSNTTLPANVDVDMQRVMSVFMAQLRLLLGVHQTVTSEQISVIEAGNQLIADWELDEWLREKCIENIFTSSSTLISLAELLGKIGNIVINDDIGAQVVSSVEAIQRSSLLLASGQLQQAFLVSKLARDASEKAFFDPSLLELLYFPEDQKFAIYVPLFLPVGFPIVLSLVQAVKWLRGTHSKKEEKVKKE